MDTCTKLKVFNLLLVFCAVNFFLYRFFTGEMLYSNKVMSMDHRRDEENKRTDEDTPLQLRDIQFLPGSENSDSSNNGSPSDWIGDSIRLDAKSYMASNGSAKESENRVEGSKKFDQNNMPAVTGVDKIKDGVSVETQRYGVAGVEDNAQLPMCPVTPPGLIGSLATYSEAISFEEVAQSNPGLRLGGRYSPSNCTARHRVAIVIPYRNREQHLKILLRNLHPMLMRQQLDYGIYVIDQSLPGRFNRAMLMNIGFVEALKRYDYQCAVFHDVDLIPEDDRNIYSCPEQPRHMSAAVDKFKYRLPYAGIYGGVSAVNKKQFQAINGFSNMYFGWGGEDDDMAKR
ncbi:beta-1,4-galactosyltransferase 1 [Plakobranchus ocellatus]|uniref:Beta-1,4-galactosyltransferase n=1 Tax=Plakobranchus ocellatus TaxID=259542 RepID=A0AAV3YS69_9GAST|nr:beta-1,4-galactosyltransferase 1 [Plakobranchus ocellatus]